MFYNHSIFLRRYWLIGFWALILFSSTVRAQSANQNPGQNPHQNSEQSAHQNPGQSAHQNPGQNAHQNSGQSAHQNPGQSANQNPGQNAHQNPGQNAHQNPGQTANQNAGQSANQNAGQTAHQNPLANPNQGMLNRIQSYLDFLISNPNQLLSVENRLLFDIREPSQFSIFRGILQQKLEEDPDQILYADLMAWTYIQEKDFPRAYILEMALDKRENTEGEKLMGLGRICRQNQAFSIALQAFQSVIKRVPKSKLYRSAKWELLETKKKQILWEGYQTKDYAALAALYTDYLKEFPEGEEINQVKLDLAKLEMGYLNELDQAGILLRALLQNPKDFLFEAECKMELAHVDILKGLVWEAALLLTQVYNDFKEEAQGQEALFEASKLYYYAGDFRLAKSQLDILKTATSELTANDAIDLSLLIQKNLEEDSSGKALKVFAHAELLIYQHRWVPAQKLLDSITKSFPVPALEDDIFMAKYKIHFSQHEYAEADQDLQTILDKYPKGIWADDALFHKAELYETVLKMPVKAKDLYEQLILKYPGSYYISESRKRFRVLRGDVIN